jgi:type VI secretion system protein ImpH
LAAPPWTAEHPLVRWVLRGPREFDYFQLLHLVERIERDAPLVGHLGPAQAERIRLRPTLSLCFPPADLDTAEWRDGLADADGRLLLTTTFLGLYGSDSPLPTHFTERLLPEQEDDLLVREFLDLFHHRLYCLLYRVWKKYRYYVEFRADGRDPISEVVRGFLGIATAHLDEALGVPAVQLFRYTGLLMQRPRSSSGLIGLLRDFFDEVEFDLEPCVGRWLTIQLADQNRLGLGKCTLGEDFLIGERVFDRSGKFRVKIGPVGFEHYQRFLPPGDRAAELRELVRFYCDDPLDFDVQVTLRGEEVPETPLGERGMLGRLSWTSWLKSQPCEDKSVIFTVPSAVN